MSAGNPDQKVYVYAVFLFPDVNHRRDTNHVEHSGTKITSQNRSDHGGRKRAQNYSAAEIARFLASPAAKKKLAAGDFWG